MSYHRMHLLLIEDNFIARKAIESMVKQAGCHFSSTENAESAFSLVKNQSFDLIVSDIGLPGMSGIELAEQIRAWEEQQHIKQPIPIIGLTAHVQKEIGNQCLKAGMNAVYTKPMTHDVLQTILNSYLPYC